MGAAASLASAAAKDGAAVIRGGQRDEMGGAEAVSLSRAAAEEEEVGPWDTGSEVCGLPAVHGGGDGGGSDTQWVVLTSRRVLLLHRRMDGRFILPVQQVALEAVLDASVDLEARTLSFVVLKEDVHRKRRRLRLFRRRKRPGGDHESMVLECRGATKRDMQMVRNVLERALAAGSAAGDDADLPL